MEEEQSCCGLPRRVGDVLVIVPRSPVSDVGMFSLRLPGFLSQTDTSALHGHPQTFTVSKVRVLATGRGLLICTRGKELRAQRDGLSRRVGVEVYCPAVRWYLLFCKPDDGPRHM